MPKWISWVLELVKGVAVQVNSVRVSQLNIWATQLSARVSQPECPSESTEWVWKWLLHHASCHFCVTRVRKVTACVPVNPGRCTDTRVACLLWCRSCPVCWHPYCPLSPTKNSGREGTHKHTLQQSRFYGNCSLVSGKDHWVFFGADYRPVHRHVYTHARTRSVKLSVLVLESLHQFMFQKAKFSRTS